jgi:hypothetical protein
MYKKQVSTGEQFSDARKHVMLQNAIHHLEELCAIKTQADQHKTQSSTDLMYEQYIHLLVSAASKNNMQFLPKEHQGRSSPCHAVYAHDSAVHEDVDIIVSVNGSYDIDMSVDTLYAYAMNHSPGSHMPFAHWQSLSDGAKTTWDMLPDSDKALILGNGTAPPARTPPGNHPGRPSCGQNVHSIDAALIAANLHELGIGNSGTNTAPGDGPLHETNPLSTDDGIPILAAHSTKRSWTKPQGDDLPPSDIRKVLSLITHKAANQPDLSEITIKGKTYRLVNATILYIMSAALQSTKHGLLMDRGANGSVTGIDACIILFTLHSVDIQGLDNHQVTNISIMMAGGIAMSQCGPVIVILNQYAGIGCGHTIHSLSQLEAYGNDVNDRSVKVQSGLQRITTLDGYVFPINIFSGLPYVNMRPCTDAEWDSLPHVVWTGDSDWDPTILDHNLDDDEHWFDAISDLEARPFTNLFDEFGNYHKCVLVVQNAVLATTADYIPTFHDALAESPIDDVEDWLDSIVYDANRLCLTIHHTDVTPSLVLSIPRFQTMRGSVHSLDGYPLQPSSISSRS